jgi:hypothetical protein
MMTKWLRIAALALIPMMAACTEDNEGTTDVDPADDVATIRLTMGSQSVDISRTGSVAGNFEVPRGPSTVTATFLRSNGTPISLPATGSFQINIVSSNSSRLTVGRTSPFVMTLNGVQTGAVTLQVSLMHGSHDDIGPFNVSATVLPASDN